MFLFPSNDKQNELFWLPNITFKMFANKFLFFNKMAEDTKILVLVNQIDKLDLLW